MAKARKKVDVAPPGPAMLLFSREKAKAMLEERVRLGGALLELRIGSSGDLRRADAEHSTWTEYNVDLLTRMFDGPEYATEHSAWGAVSIRMNPSLREQIDRLH